MIKIFNTLLQLWPQCFAALTVTLLSTSLGLAFGWTSPYLAQLTGENPPFRITNEEGSWIASLLPLGRLLGAVIGALTLEYIGSKISVLFSGLPMIFSWICITCAISPVWLYVARIFSGISMGMIISSYPLYIGEISAPSIRGALTCTIINGFPIGTLFGNVMGPNMSMMYFGIISLILTLCFMGIFPFFPQTPYYYVQRNDTKRTEKSIQWYYQKSDVRSEIEAIEYFVKEKRAMNMRERLKQLKEPKNRRAFLMLTMLNIFTQFCGVSTIVFYMEIIVTKGRVTMIKPSTLVIIINTIGIIIGWIGTFVIDHSGRRMVAAISSFGVMVGMALLGLHFFLLDYGYDPSGLEWLMVLALLMIMLLNFGVTQMPTTLMSEIFSSDLKSVGGFVGSIMSATFAFIASKTYQPLIDLISAKYVYWIYAVIFLISLVYSLTVLPETKGKTLEEIQEMMATKYTTQKSQQKTRVETENIEKYSIRNNIE